MDIFNIRNILIEMTVTPEIPVTPEFIERSRVDRMASFLILFASDAGVASTVYLATEGWSPAVSYGVSVLTAVAQIPPFARIWNEYLHTPFGTEPKIAPLKTNPIKRCWLKFAN